MLSNPPLWLYSRRALVSQMLKARLVELSVVGSHVLSVVLAVAIGVRFSVWLGLVAWIALVLGMTSMSTITTLGS